MHLSVEVVYLLVLRWRIGPPKQDVAPGVLGVEVVLSKRTEESSAVAFVQESDDPVAASDELVAHDAFSLWALRRC